MLYTKFYTSSIVGVIGRVGTSVKVKGMFVHEQQLKQVMTEVGCPTFQAIVTSENDRDQLTIYTEKELGKKRSKKLTTSFV
ncbi:hypothetical protein ABEV15_04470 [Bhargavaea massiliensis]